MGFDDHRVACRESRRCVSTRDRECQGKVTGAKNGDRPERAQHRTNIGARKRFTLAIGFIDAGIHPRALFEHLGKQKKLTCCSAKLIL